MSWIDDVPAKKPAGIVVGEPLAALSVGELEARVAALKAEIDRVEAELAAKRKHEQAAAAIFKR